MVLDKVKNFLNYNLMDAPKDISRSIKAIGVGFRTVGTTLPPAEGNFLNFLQIASEEDSARRIVIRNPYLQNAWVYSATRIMGENLAQVPFILTDKNDEVINSSSIKYGGILRLFEYVSPYMNKYSLFESVPIWLSLRGECFWQLIRSEVGNYPVRIKVIRPETMNEIVVDDELLAWEEWTDNGRKITHDVKDIIQFKYFNPYSYWRGLSPLIAALLGLHIDYAAGAYNYFFFNNDSTPAGVLTSEQDLDPDEAKAGRIEWNKNQKGLKKKGRIAILGKGMKYQPIALAQKDIQYIEQKKWSRAEVFAVLGVSPALVGVLEDSSIKSNIKEQRAQLFENNLIPKMHFIEAVLKTDLFDRERLPIKGKFDISSIAALKESFDKILEQAVKLQTLGFTGNEINEKLNLGFKEEKWRDYWWIGFNVVPADETASTPTKDEKSIDSTQMIKVDEKGVTTLGDTFEKKVQPRKDLVWRGLIRQTEKIEESFNKKLQEYFYKMRQDVLNNIFAHKSIEFTEIIERELLLNVNKLDTWSIKSVEEELLFNSSEYDKLLDGITREELQKAYEVGTTSLKDVLNTTYDMTYIRAVQSMSKRIKAITGINETVREQLLGDYKPILERSLKEGLTYEQVAGELAEVARVKFNNARARSKTIAQTEINGAMNQARQDSMIDSGVEKEQWSTSLKNVRESHIPMDGQVRKLDEPFTTGHGNKLFYPGDPAGAAEEVINCYCIALPVIK